MAFKLAKASGVRVPDLVEDIVADATSLPIGEIESGILVTIASDGELEKGASGTAVAGIIAADPGAARYAAPGSEVYTPTFKDTDRVPFLPVTGTLLIEADVSGTLTEFVAGKAFDFEATNWTVVGAAIPTNGDFFVVRTVTNKAGTVVAVQGFFVTPGYFTA